jgi:hypothetical protein
MKIGLQNLIIKYPNDDVVPKAQDILNKMKIAQTPASSSNDAKDTTSSSEPKDEVREKMFSKNKKEKHWVVLVVNKSQADAANNTIVDYCAKTNSTLNLKTNKIVLNDKQTMILIKDFKDGDIAATFTKDFKKNNEYWSKIKDTSKELLPINTPNFNSLLKSKTLNLYKNFAVITYQL